MVVEISGDISADQENGKYLQSKTHEKCNGYAGRRIPGADAGPNLKIDRAAVQQNVDDHAHNSKEKAVGVESQVPAQRSWRQSGNSRGLEETRKE